MPAPHKTVVTYGRDGIRQAWCVSLGCGWLGENLTDAGLARREGAEHSRTNPQPVA
jgi:hypothetical protein